ncbi:MAG: hypothetical protein LBV28_03765 [Puniceicoccales bacterium]|jgi:hypothetical protein|nr:hypothetical protein [Puniceicoccales bacterium]
MHTHVLRRFFRHGILATTLLGIGAVALPAQVFQFGTGASPGNRWEINDPFSKTPPDPRKATWSSTGNITLRTASSSITKKITEVTLVDWGKELPQALKDAETEVQRGEASKALTLIEPVVVQFAPIKKVRGSLWLTAASVKLDALVLLKNDAVITDFIRELEEADNGSIPGLGNRIKLAKIEQTLRKGNTELALADAEKLIRDTVDVDLIASLHLVKGDALLSLRRYEQAMTVFLRIPVFYGTQTKLIPAAQLGAARAFRGMNSPANKHLQLDDVANRYLTDIIEQFPISKEAEIARGMLTKADRETLAQKSESGIDSVKAAGAEAGPEEEAPAAAPAPAPQ